MGDKIICNGLIREICNNNPQDQHLLATRKHNLDSISFMYRDLKNLETVLINETYELPIVISKSNSDKFIKIGHGLIDIDKHFDEGFYEQHNIPFEKRWSSFHLQRDEQREDNFFKKFNIDCDYAFIHEDEKRGMLVTKNLDPSLRLIKADKSLTSNIFDYLKIIENAKEIHCIPSSFLFLIDSFNFKGEKFLHKYSRHYPHHGAPSLRLNWKELE
jgi:hypothetical protein